MELVARKADLVRELQFFQQIVERKNTIPILANVLLEGTDDRTLRRSVGSAQSRPLAVTCGSARTAARASATA